MQPTLLLLNLYFTLVLLVSGLAKLDNVYHFESVLRNYKLLPNHIIRSVSYIFPWFEVALATALLSGVFPLPTSVITSVIFSIFLYVEVFLIANNRTAECGCYGIAYIRKVDKATASTSFIMLCATLLQTYLVSTGITIPNLWRIPSIIAFVIFTAWLIRRIWLKHQSDNNKNLVTPVIIPLSR